MERIEDKMFVILKYKGTLKNGDVFGDSEKSKPLEIEMGKGHMPKAFEQALMGMALNEKKEFTLTPEEAYGNRDDSRVLDIPIADVPPEMDIETGQIISLATQDGSTVSARVTDMNDNKVTVDLNHPLADETLIFNVEVVGISKTKPLDLGGCGSDCGSSCSSSGCC